VALVIRKRQRRTVWLSRPVAGSVEEAEDIALGEALGRGVGEIMVIGGREIFPA